MGDRRLYLHGTWSRSVGGREIDRVEVPGSYRPVGECVLERHFTRPPGFLREGARYFLCTDGVLSSAEFDLNGSVVGRAGPWVPYRFELASGALAEANAVRARVRDLTEAFGPAPGRRFDGGLFRAIWVERRPACYISSFAFRHGLSEGLSRADCTVEVELDGEAPPGLDVEAELVERASGRTVASARAAAGEPLRFAVGRPLLWSPETPFLYDITVRTIGPEPDEVSDAVGFRTLEVRGRDFRLNNERLILKGVCRHEFMSGFGYSPPEDEVRRELALIRHSGFNYVRLVHSPQAPCVPRIAAEVGLLVSEEPGTCFHDLADPDIAAPALEALRRTVLRDRNCPSIMAWLIYNECSPNSDYAALAAEVVRALDPGGLVSFADCSGRDDEIKAMVAAAGLSYVGVNMYTFHGDDIRRRADVFTDSPLVVTEWGGWIGRGNGRVLDYLCDTFVECAQGDAPHRLAGSSFWAWADYEEYSRAEPASVDGWTVEGLIDQERRPRPDLARLSRMCFETDHPPKRPGPRVDVVGAAPLRGGAWRAVALDEVAGDQAALEAEVARMRAKYSGEAPAFGRLVAAGVPFECRAGGAGPLLVGKGRDEVVIPVGEMVRAVAVLGHVAWGAAYPASAVFSVHHRDQEPARAFGDPAGEYVFEFSGGEVVVPLEHGRDVLRANNICRWWMAAPRAPNTVPGARAVVHPSYEILRIDVWERAFERPRRLERIVWRTRDPESIQAMFALSILKE